MGILAGPIYLLKALFMVLRHPRLIRLGLIPSICTLVLSGLGLWLTISYSDGLVQAIWPEPSDGALHWVWAAVSGLISISSSVLIVIITPWMVMIFGIPLCEPLSAEVDILLGGQHEAASFVGTLMDTIRTTLVLSVIGIGGAVGFFALGLVPGLALITTPFVALIWTPFFATFNVYDSPMARRQLTVKQKFSVVLRHPFQTLSFGLVAVALLSIPLINLLGLPIIVTAGVMVVRDLENKERLVIES